MLFAAIAAALIAGAASSVAAGPICPCMGIEMGHQVGGDGMRPHVDGLEPGSARAPVAVTRTEADGSKSTIYVDPRTFTPVLPGMPGCTTAP